MRKRSVTISTYLLLGIFSVFLLHLSFPHHHHEKAIDKHHHVKHGHSHEHSHNTNDHNSNDHNSNDHKNAMGSHSHAIDFAQFNLKKNESYSVEQNTELSSFLIETAPQLPDDIFVKRIFDSYHSPPDSPGYFTFNSLRAPPFLG